MTSEEIAGLQLGDRIAHSRLGVLELKDVSLSPRDVGTGMGGEGGFSVRVFLFETLDGREQYEVQEPELSDAGIQRAP